MKEDSSDSVYQSYSNVINKDYYFSTSKPTSVSFSEVVVDFGTFDEAEPEPNLIDSALTPFVSLIPVATLLLLSIA